MPAINYALRQFAIQQIDLQAIAQHMYPLMLRNISGPGFVFADPADPKKFSAPGCVLASPSYPANQADISQNYVYNWVRDAAIAAIEIAAANPPVRPDGGAETLVDYVTFAALCRTNAVQAGRPTHACFTIEGSMRDWTDQSDGPALQTLAILGLYGQLDPATRTVALALANANVTVVLDTCRQPTVNLWEEVTGHSFFARAAQLRCLPCRPTRSASTFRRPSATRSGG